MPTQGRRKETCYLGGRTERGLAGVSDPAWLPFKCCLSTLTCLGCSFPSFLLAFSLHRLFSSSLITGQSTAVFSDSGLWAGTHSCHRTDTCMAPNPVLPLRPLTLGDKALKETLGPPHPSAATQTHKELLKVPNHGNSALTCSGELSLKDAKESRHLPLHLLLLQDGAQRQLCLGGWEKGRCWRSLCRLCSVAATPGSGGPWAFETAPASNAKTPQYSSSRFTGRKLWRFGGLGCKNVYPSEFCFFLYLTVVLCALLFF